MLINSYQLDVVFAHFLPISGQGYVKIQKYRVNPTSGQEKKIGEQYPSEYYTKNLEPLLKPLLLTIFYINKHDKMLRFNRLSTLNLNYFVGEVDSHVTCFPKIIIASCLYMFYALNGKKTRRVNLAWQSVIIIFTSA